MEKDCIFCSIVRDEVPSVTIYETDEVKVILDKFPSVYGHCLVVSKKHFKDIYDIDEDLYANMMKEAVKVAKKLKKILKCDGINILQNNEVVAGQSVFHIHIHIIPRYKDDTVTIKWNTKEISEEKMLKIANELNRK